MELPIFSHRSGKSYQKYFELDEIEGFPLEVRDLGKLALPSQRAIVGDPFGQRIQAPLAGEVPNAEKSPIELCLVHADGAAHPAMIRWKFEAKPAAEWFLAVSEDVPDEDVIALQENEYIGTECPSGWVLLGDADIYQEYLLQASPLMGKKPETLLNEAREDQNTPQWATVPVGDNQAVVAVDGNWEGGLFPTYWGIGENKQIVELVIDLFVIGV